MKLRKFRPGDRQHLGGGVELHRAGAERDHRPVECQIPVGKAAHVARHLALGPVHVEDRVGQVLRGPLQIRGQARLRVGLVIGQIGAAEGAPDRLQDVGPGALIDADADTVVAHPAQVHSVLDRALQDHALERADPHGDGVEEVLRLDGEAEALQLGGETHRVAVDPQGDGLESGRPVIDREHRGDDREQHLAGADVRGRLLAPDMLLAGLEREAIRAVAAGIHRHADDAAGQRPLVGVAGRQIGGVRAAIAHGYAVALHRADGDVGAHLARCLEERQRQRVGGDHGERAGLVQTGDDVGEIVNRAVHTGILEQRPEDGGRIEIQGIADDDLPAQRRRAGPQHGDGLGQAVAVDEERVPVRLRHAARHAHGFRRGGGLVEERGVGHVERGQVADQGLEVEQRLQPALADLGLVGRVGGVPGRVLEDVALNRRRHRRAVVALADQRDEQPVLVGGGAQLLQRAPLGQRGAEIDVLRLPDVGRQSLVDQRVQRLRADRLQHLVDLGEFRADMAPGGEIEGIVAIVFHRMPLGRKLRLSLSPSRERVPAERAGEGPARVPPDMALPSPDPR